MANRPARGGGGRGGRGRGGGPRQGVPPVLPGAPAAPALISYEDSCRNWKIPVTKKRTDLIDGFAKLNIHDVHLVKGNDTNQHAISAGIRSLLTVEALRMLYEKGCRSVLSVYGSERDEKLNNLINSKVNPQDHLFLDLYMPNVVPKDVHRNRGVPRIPQLPAYDGLLFVDIYNTEAGSFDPTWLAAVMRQYGARYAAWVGHAFMDQCGVVFNEGAWIKLPSGRIKMFSDHEPGNYCGHDSCDWIWTQDKYDAGPDDLVWSFARGVGSMKCVAFTLSGKTQTDVLPLLPPPLYETVQIPIFDRSRIPRMIAEPLVHTLPTWMSLKLFNSNIVKIPVALWSMLKRSMVLRGRDKLSLSILTERVKTWMSADVDYKLLMKFFPEEFENYCEYISLGAFYHKIEGTEENLWFMRLLYGNTVKNLNDHMNNLDNAPPSRNLTWPYFLGGLLLSQVYPFNRLTGWCVRKLYHTFVPKLPGALPLSESIGKGVIKALMWVNEIFDVPRIVGECLYQKLPIYLQRLCKAELINEGLTVVLAAPTIEEVFKRCFPGGRYLLPAWEFMVYRFVHNIPIHQYLPTMLMHLYAGSLPLKLGIFLHSIFNLWLFVGRCFPIAMGVENTVTPVMLGCLGLSWYLFGPMWCGQSLFAKFKDYYYGIGRFDNPVDPNLHCSEAFDPSLAFVPVEPESCVLKPKPLCSLMVSKGEFEYPSHIPKTGFWYLLPNSIPCRVPGRTDMNLEAVLRHRVLVAAPLHPLVQKARWALVDHFVDIFPPIDWSLWVKPYVAHFEEPAKKKRYKDTLRILETLGFEVARSYFNCVKVMVKTDEALVKLDEDDCVRLKPRCIANVNPMLQLLIGPEIYAATLNLKVAWSVTEPVLRKATRFSYYLSYAGAATDHDLSIWMRRAMMVKEGEFYIVVSGDDSLVVTRKGLDLQFMIGDMGMFDQSQSFGCLDHEHKSLKMLGVSQRCVADLQQISTLPYVATSRKGVGRIVIDRKLRPIRDTGGPDTSIGNSLNNGHAWVEVLDKHSDIVSGFSYLGFDLKFKTTTQITECDFLKGMWYPVDDPDFLVYWGPLPSRLLKIGKTLRNPCELYKINDIVKAASYYLNDLACTYSYYLRVPLLRIFVKNFYKTVQIKDNLLESYKVQAAKIAKPRCSIDALVAVANRYGVHLIDILQFEREYPSAPFVFHAHPLYYRMAKIDYS